MEYKDALLRAERLQAKGYVIDYRNGDVEKDGVKVTTIRLPTEGLINFVNAVKLGLL